MSFENYKGKTKDELIKTLLDLKKEQMELRFKHAGGQLEKVDQLHKVRKNIARVQTAMTAPVATETKKAAPAKTKTTAKKADKAA